MVIRSDYKQRASSLTKQRSIVAGVFLFLIVIYSCNRNQLPGTSASKKVTLKVMTYNIHHANPPSRAGVIDLDAIAKVIQKQGPDLVALQEVDVHTKRSGKTVNQAEELAHKTGMYFYFAKAIDFEGGDYGVAILSKFPLSSPLTYHLPVAAGTRGEPRVLATAMVSMPGGKKLVFACTHLDAQKSDTNRVLQINEVTNILKKEQYEVIVGGDFNATPHGKVIDVLDQFLRRTCANNCPFTIPVLKPAKTIDFIAYSPPGKFLTISHRVIRETYASDHLPVIADIQTQ